MGHSSDEHAYRERLLLYYEEEIMGRAFFGALARAAPDPDTSHKLTLLAEVERYTAEATRPLIERHGLIPRPEAELCALGEHDAERFGADWNGIVANMLASYDRYIEQFRELEHLGPETDRDRLATLTDHEVAALDFARRERDGTPRAEVPLLDFLLRTAAAYPEDIRA